MIALAAMKTISRLLRRLRHAGHSFIGDRRAIAAISGFQASVLVWLFLGGLVALEQIKGAE